MHIEEAWWIRSALEKYSDAELSTLLNIGSSTKKFRSVDQPYIENGLFRKIRG